ncbi:EGF-like repeat and discoidin I-like domain-containing protein 3 [Dendronephthya gigantea]|uniref:EGF-like repeat and discoidin I-like domain-containing protein 3 n=1 Tax=Dendronephthya gigantea TaxID=151771 RepID=UPI00106A42A3|nr:EGF-like repeat and discoidin I-like domain-containing protein 3 [Dendronephthya gigantea]
MELFDNVSRRNIDPMIMARYVRFLPLEFNIEAVVRLEFYGCNGVHYCLRNPCLNGGICNEILPASYECICAAGYTGPHCEVEQLCATSPCNYGGTCFETDDSYICRCTEYYSGPNCDKHCSVFDAVGIADESKILDAKITASSSQRDTFGPSIATQGKPNSEDTFVKTYSISYSLDGNNFVNYTENGTAKIFTGNTDGNTVVENDFSFRFSAIFVKVHPKTSGNGGAGLRMELYSCKSRK